MSNPQENDPGYFFQDWNSNEMFVNIIIIVIIIIIIHQWKHHKQDKEETQDHPQETQGNSR